MADFSALVCERLAACALDMGIGIKRAWNTPPSKKIQRTDCPCSFTLVGATYDRVSTSRGVLEIPRTYIQRFLVMPFSGGADDIRTGSESLTRANDLIDKIHAYYQAHALLHTAALESLRYCKGIERISDSGPVARIAPGGGQYTAIDFSINIRMAGNIP